MFDQQLYLFPETDLSAGAPEVLADLANRIDAAESRREFMRDIAGAISDVGRGGVVIVGHSPAVDAPEIIDHLRRHVAELSKDGLPASLSPRQSVTIALPPAGGKFAEQRGLLVDRIEAATRRRCCLEHTRSFGTQVTTSSAPFELEIVEAANLPQEPHLKALTVLVRRNVSVVFITQADQLFASNEARKSGPRICEFLRDIARDSQTTFVLLGHRKSLLKMRVAIAHDRIPEARWVNQRLYDPNAVSDMKDWARIIKMLLRKVALQDATIQAISSINMALAVGGDVSRVSRWLRQAMIDAYQRGSGSLSRANIERTTPKMSEVRSAEEELDLYRDWLSPARSVFQTPATAQEASPPPPAPPKEKDKAKGGRAKRPQPGNRKATRDAAPKGKAA